MSDHRFAPGRDERRKAHRSRLEDHRAATDAQPLTPLEVEQWRQSLSGLNTAEGKAGQLRVCRMLIAHAPEDHMLDSDAGIILASIRDLEQELSAHAHPESVAVLDTPSSPGDGPLPADTGADCRCTEQDDASDEFDIGYTIGDDDPDPDDLLD